MKKLLIFTVIFATMIVSAGCVLRNDYTESGLIISKNRFQPAGQVFVTPIGYPNIRVLEDTETKILYLTNTAGGMTQWLDADGQPMKAE